MPTTNGKEQVFNFGIKNNDERPAEETVGIVVTQGDDGTIGKVVSLGTLQPVSTKLPVAYTTIVAWGDSLTAGAGSTGGLTYPNDLATLTAFTVLNKGVGGETSTQIKDRMIADTANYDKTVIIWAGRNGADVGSDVKSDIAAMISALGHDRYLVLGIINGDYAQDYKGGTAYNNIVALNSDLKNIYGKKYVDIRERLVSLHDDTTQGLLDFSRDIVPYNLRSDNIHLNNLGYQYVSEYIFQRLGIALNQEGYLQSKDVKGLVEDLNFVHKFGNETITGLKTLTNTANTADTGLIFNNSGTGLNANNIKSNISSGGNFINGDVTAGGSLLYGNITGSTGFGTRLINGGTAHRIDNYTTSSRGILINIFNNSRGIDTQNGGTGASYYANNTLGGIGFQAITPAGIGFSSTVTSAAIGMSLTSQSSASLVRLDGLSGVSGNLFEVRSLGSIVSFFNSLGILNTPSPVFTGTPTAPTATAGTNTTQLATTAFVSTAISGATAPTLQAVTNSGATSTLGITAQAYQVTGGNVYFSGNSAGTTNMPLVCRIAGRLGLVSSTTNAQAVTLNTDALTATRELVIRDITGTIALTSDIPYLGVKMYTALITQSSTGAPTVSVLGNNGIGAIVWTRTGTGTYVGTLSSAFTANKTACTFNNTVFGSVTIQQTSLNTITITTADLTGTLMDGRLTNNTIKIEVYS